MSADRTPSRRSRRAPKSFRPPARRPIAIANRYDRLRIERRALTQAIAVLDANHDALAKRSSQLRNDNELSLVFLTDRELARLHGDFLADPTETDVITFEGDSALGFAGEVCVSVDAALRHVARLRRPKSRGNPAVSPAAFSGELLLYVVHGWLHLAGHDDLKPEKKRVMRRAERRAMSLLEAAGCVDVFELK